jgi:hypothetical protein
MKTVITLYPIDRLQDLKKLNSRALNGVFIDRSLTISDTSSLINGKPYRYLDCYILYAARQNTSFSKYYTSLIKLESRFNPLPETPTTWSRSDIEYSYICNDLETIHLAYDYLYWSIYSGKFPLDSRKRMKTFWTNKIDSYIERALNDSSDKYEDSLSEVVRATF